MSNVFHTNSNKLESGDGSDCIYGNKANETLYGYGGNDYLWGGNGSDKLYGGDGNDILHGGYGLYSDELYGGSGADTFRFTYYNDSRWDKPDLIGDFESGVDKIDFCGLHLTADQVVITSQDATHHQVTVLINELPENNMLIDVTGTAPTLNDIVWA